MMKRFFLDIMWARIFMNFFLPTPVNEKLNSVGESIGTHRFATGISWCPNAHLNSCWVTTDALPSRLYPAVQEEYIPKIHTRFCWNKLYHGYWKIWWTFMIYLFIMTLTCIKLRLNLTKHKSCTYCLGTQAKMKCQFSLNSHLVLT